MNSSIQYTGEVFIKTNNITHKYKNSGTVNLFKFLCNVLSYVVTPVTHELFLKSAPCYIDIVTSIDSSNTNYEYTTTNSNSILVKPLLISTKEHDAQSVEYNALLQRDLIMNTSSIQETGTSSGYYVLIDGEKKHILAYTECVFSDLYPLTSQEGSQATITWKLTFDNKDEVQGE